MCRARARARAVETPRSSRRDAVRVVHTRRPPRARATTAFRYAADWALWVDADAWFNPANAWRPLDAWLGAVPPHKPVALANYRSLNTGVLAVRTGRRGRALLDEWRAVAASGAVQCHPHDQAALQLLLLWKLNGSTAERAPFGCARARARAPRAYPRDPRRALRKLSLIHI